MVKEQIENLIKKDIQSFEEIRNKDGVILVRIYIDGKSFVLKYFEKKEHAREIGIYKLFKKLGIQTLKIFKLGEDFILMEDVNCSKEYHLATPQDLEDDDNIKNLALWYKQLHKKGRGIDLSNLYCENNLITKENIQKLDKLLPQKNIDLILGFWQYIELAKLSNNYTITYNDFACENMIVGQNCAFMYDYNLVGKGCVSADIGNVLAMLDNKRKKIFLDAYGWEQKDYFIEGEVESVFSNLISAIIASKREKLPEWAKPSLERIKNPLFIEKLQNLKKLFGKGN